MSSYSKPFADRERALEDAFFREESTRLLAAMRERQSRQEQFDALASTLGVRDASVIDPLLDLGLKEHNVTALVMAPLVVIAWADRNLDNEERRTILAAEHELGIAPESEAGKLLSVWLDHRPHEGLLDAWAAYVKELCRVLDQPHREKLRNDIVGWSHKVSKTMEKSFLRGGGPGRAERQALEAIEAAFAVDGEHSKVDPASVTKRIDDAINSMT